LCAETIGLWRTLNSTEIGAAWGVVETKPNLFEIVFDNSVRMITWFKGNARLAKRMLRVLVLKLYKTIFKTSY